MVCRLHESKKKFIFNESKNRKEGLPVMTKILIIGLTKIEGEEKEYKIVYTKNNEILTFEGNAEECLDDLKKSSDDA